MTSRSRRKHPTIRPTLRRAKLYSALILSVVTAVPAWAAPPSISADAFNAPGMRSVPRRGTTMAPPTRSSSTSSLQWRRSDQVTPTAPVQAVVAAPVQTAVPAPVQTPVQPTLQTPVQSHVQPPARLAVQPTAAPIAAPTTTVARVAYNYDEDQRQMRREPGPSVAVAQFEFLGDGLPEPSAAELDQPQVDDLFEQPLGQPQVEAIDPPAPNALRNRQRPSPLGDMLRDTSPQSPSDLRLEEVPAPQPQRDDRFESPFDEDISDDGPDGARDPGTRDPMTTDGFRDDGLAEGSDSESEFDMDDEPNTGAGGLTCEEFRKRIAVQTIDQVSLDISPPYRPDEINIAKYERIKKKFDSEQANRTFRNIAGAPLATGKFRDLAYGKVVLETDRGETAIQFSDLSEADLAYVTQEFGLPNECLLRQQENTPRNWRSLAMSWKASNMCHSPLYFEDVNLERYGHTHGPLAEPLVQTAHFFGSVLVLPYKMGVHHPRECIYTLGYYRPGNCAPWILPAVPISARGILNQAAVMTAGTLLIP